MLVDVADHLSIPPRHTYYVTTINPYTLRKEGGALINNLQYFTAMRNNISFVYVASVFIFESRVLQKLRVVIKRYLYHFLIGSV